jgi:hypothetical protein
VILTAHQPSYLPWLGLFHKISLADEFCIFDMVQYVKKGFDNRNLVKTAQGPKWLTVPVESSGHFSKLCSEIKIINNGWARKHIKTIDLAYRRAPFYDLYMGQIEELLAGRKYDLLADLDRAILAFGLESFGLSPVVHRAQDYFFTGVKSELVLDMCMSLGATEYIFGGEGQNYADTNTFIGAGVRPHFLDYEHPIYSQLHGDFVPNMSFIDLLFNVGPESKYLVKSAGSSRQGS